MKKIFPFLILAICLMGMAAQPPKPKTAAPGPARKVDGLQLQCADASVFAIDSISQLNENEAKAMLRFSINQQVNPGLAVDPCSEMPMSMKRFFKGFNKKKQEAKAATAELKPPTGMPKDTFKGNPKGQDVEIPAPNQTPVNPDAKAIQEAKDKVIAGENASKK